MGGDTFENTRRLSRKEFEETRDRVGNILDSLGEGVSIWCSPKEVADKDSYGDVDFVACLHTDILSMATFKKTVTERVGALETEFNAEHLSFLTPERFQVDILICSSEEFDTCKGFYSNGDFSYCLGKMIYKDGLKWSSRGLSYRFEKPPCESNVNIPNSELEVILTRSTKEAFTFLGISEPSIDLLLDDHKEIEQLQLIEILSESTYYRRFLGSPSDMKRLFNKHRDRRPMVRAFFDHCAQQAVSLGLEATSNKKENRLKTETEILSFFGKHDEFQRVEQYLKNVEEIKKTQNEAKKKFNGTHVELWLTGIPKKLLGSVMKNLRDSVSGDYYEWILATDEEKIKEKVLEIYNSLHNEKQDSEQNSKPEREKIT